VGDDLPHPLLAGLPPSPVKHALGSIDRYDARAVSSQQRMLHAGAAAKVQQDRPRLRIDLGIS
jgi:hypothetical protein